MKLFYDLFISIGNKLVFSVYKRVHFVTRATAILQFSLTETSSQYCDKLCYIFSFSVLTLIYSFLTIVVLFLFLKYNCFFKCFNIDLPYAKIKDVKRPIKIRIWLQYLFYVFIKKYSGTIHIDETIFFSTNFLDFLVDFWLRKITLLYVFRNYERFRLRSIL